MSSDASPPLRSRGIDPPDSVTPLASGNQSAVEPAATDRSRIFISYKRDAEPDAAVAAFLYDTLTRQGHDVFLDVEIPPGADWAELIANEIRRSHLFVVLLSETSAAAQGFVVEETLMAKDSQKLTGYPKILPVRLAYEKKLTLRLSAAIAHLQHFEWRNASDNDALRGTVVQSISKPDASGAAPTSLLRGDHFIATGSLWQAVGPRESLDGTMIVPVTAGQEINLAVTRTERPGFFGLRVLEHGALEVAIWSGAAYRSVESAPGAFILMFEGDSHQWCFTRFDPEQAVLLERSDGRKDPIVLTFDRDVVRAVWRIDHQRAAHRESFVIVMKDPTAH